MKLNALAKPFIVLLLGTLSACAARAPHTDSAGEPRPLLEHTAQHVLTAWQQELTRYITRDGSVDPALLAQTRVLRSRDALRPARIVFGVLDVDASAPGRDGWDVQGMLIGKQVTGAQTWYVFVVGIVERAGYRPSSIQDMRLIAFSAPGSKLAWNVGPGDQQAVKRYLQTFSTPPIRFPGDTDRFTMDLSGNVVSVLEAQSGARWQLQLSADRAQASDGKSARMQPSTKL
jgi:hypothetical protein